MDDLKARLLANRLPEEEVEIPGVGSVTVRGLSHAEVLLMQKSINAVDPEKIDPARALIIQRKLVAAGLVKPKMTEGEVRRWQENGKFGELDPVSDAISRLSGLEELAVKAAHKSVPDGPRNGVPVLPSGEAADDRGGDVGAAE